MKKSNLTHPREIFSIIYMFIYMAVFVGIMALCSSVHFSNTRIVAGSARLLHLSC